MWLDKVVVWPSGLRRWFKAPVSSEAWVRIPPLPILDIAPSVMYWFSLGKLSSMFCVVVWPSGLRRWF